MIKRGGAIARGGARFVGKYFLPLLHTARDLLLQAQRHPSRVVQWTETQSIKYLYLARATMRQLKNVLCETREAFHTSVAVASLAWLHQLGPFTGSLSEQRIHVLETEAHRLRNAPDDEQH